MEIRNVFENDLLARIDLDFKGELINENDESIDEVIL